MCFPSPPISNSNIFSTLVVLSMWSPDQLHLHHLGACSNCKFTSTITSETLGVGSAVCALTNPPDGFGVCKIWDPHQPQSTHFIFVLLSYSPLLTLPPLSSCRTLLIPWPPPWNLTVPRAVVGLVLSVPQDSAVIVIFYCPLYCNCWFLVCHIPRDLDRVYSIS